jgi:hypothetical protein
VPDRWDEGMQHIEDMVLDKAAKNSVAIGRVLICCQ